MSFKADIPTLSANEVYTLTFEYEGTETIQLIVGDLTLETTDRRVVFTTTSPVYYIESNVNLTNLNMYEGYYESDDFGGEYTQESYIEGKTEIVDNVMKCVKSPRIISQNEDGTEESITTTPNDLELYELSNVKDVLDLTNGLVTRKIGKLTNCHELISNHSYNEDGGYYTARLYWNKVQNINTNDNKTLGLCNVFRDGSYKQNTMWSHGMDKAYYLHFGGCTTFEEARQYCLDNNLTILYELKEPTTEQLSLNPLKSYRNGSIQTSSQQLPPTLKTTLPISNKFTTTNLTSGSTYNVYFDGTATKLDAGGTIITNPVSPCEVKCGGTTLTLEGTDIQNIRVIETTVKNEVGNNGTSDVELSSIENLDVNGENIIISKLEQPIKLRSLGTTYDSYNPATGELIKRIGVSETDGSYSVLSSPITSQVEMDNIPRIYKNGIIKIYSDSNIYPMTTLEIPTTNKYDTSTWETGVYTQRNIVEIYFNDSTTPMIPTETLTLTENHLLSGHMIIIGENPMLIKGNYTGRDIPYFTGMRSVEAIEVETTSSPDQPLFGKGGRK